LHLSPAALPSSRWRPCARRRRAARQRVSAGWCRRRFMVTSREAKGGARRGLAFRRSTIHRTSVRTSGVVTSAKRLQNWGTKRNWRRIPPTPPNPRQIVDFSESCEPDFNVEKGSQCVSDANIYCRNLGCEHGDSCFTERKQLLSRCDRGDLRNSRTFRFLPS
jgi:hypothetical protein